MTLENKILDGGRVTSEEAIWLWNNMPAAALAEIADALRRRRVDDPGEVTWQIDRNVNITNVCISGCKFCNFHCRPVERDRAYVTSMEEYFAKIDETLALGGDQLLLQGGLHPGLEIGFYETLFRTIKNRYPTLKLNALGAPEVWHIARISGLGVDEALSRLSAAGLDTLPGAGAEILSDRVRRLISPGKPGVAAWCEVMRQAHRLGIPSTATMMYGHVETVAERIDHLMVLRGLQDEAPEGGHGFTAFIPWIFRSEGTALEREGVQAGRSPLEYVKTVALSRIVLDNFRNIQASWLTVGQAAAQTALHAGANDMGSIMIEENVVSSAGARNRFDAEGMRRAISGAGFRPVLRDQLYRRR